MPRLELDVSRKWDVNEIITPSSSLEEQSTTSSQPSLALFFFLGGIVILLIALILIFVFRKTIKPAKLKMFIPRTMKQPVAKDVISGNLHTISYYDFQTLKKATKNFQEKNVLGRGGFGPVFMGKLEDGRLIAVKKLSLDKSQQGESEFLAEVRLITSIQHKNLVRLLGCCSDGAQRLLVYEYMKNRSLDLIIYEKSGTYLNWTTRFQIILGIARGLQYLHEDSHIRIVHRDIKASNILLDDKFQPRIGDFGLARFFPEGQDFLSTRFAGTLGYTAPEYAIRGELSEKADIFSFGVLVLEIISCRKNTDLSLPSEMQYLPEYAWKLYERSKLVNLIDPRIRDRSLEKDVLQAIHVAFLCLKPCANLRPPMSEIVAMLTCKVDVAGKLTRPVFLDGKQRKDEKLLWDSTTEPSPSPLSSDSPSFPWPPGKDFSLSDIRSS
ncbi:cold-responsive protein kinase 1-like [Olea europaea var. sylvestris]|uniref:cold-responsive protein kinase 1-like n=1 Tax=Olea europaea var. sylvestris TaxID=158386 RepID=UPI000C1D566B|nr:cold-responsive protein kinase 1-like [Olea europaea var. sylvestris]